MPLKNGTRAVVEDQVKGNVEAEDEDNRDDEEDRRMVMR
jgi:hypothetical protein